MLISIQKPNKKRYYSSYSNDRGKVRKRTFLNPFKIKNVMVFTFTSHVFPRFSL